MRLSEAQKRVLRTMVEFDCPVHSSSPDGYCWYGQRALFECPGKKVRLTTIYALVRSGLLEQKPRQKDHPYWRRDFLLTPKGREVAKELEEQDADKAE